MSRLIYKLTKTEKRKYSTNDPFEIADGLGIFLSFRSLNRLKGFYYLINRERHIVISSALGQEDKRVVCAHELGHDRLHRHYAKAAPFKDIIVYDFKSKPEYEANVYAADLLIEDSDIIDLIIDHDIISMGRVLCINPNMVTFKVLSMINRGYMLNLPQSPDRNFLAK